MFGILDCNNFYASCERLFRPDLIDRPVAVLSNNDGCVIARSQAVKAMGIPLGMPWFECRELLQSHRAAVFSANFSLYADISSRVMAAMQALCNNLEPYSIDEAFFALDKGPHRELQRQAGQIAQQVEMQTGIPVTIGVGRTRTLAKLTARYLKKSADNSSASNTLVTGDDRARSALLKQMSVADVWGIGSGWQAALKKSGIATAWDFVQLDPDTLQSVTNIHGVLTQRELQGIPCQFSELATADRKTVRCSRSFGNRIEDFDSLWQTVMLHLGRCCEKLRASQLYAGGISLYISAGRGRYSNQTQRLLTCPGNDTIALMAVLRSMLRDIYRPGIRYARSGVTLYALMREEQRDLWHRPTDRAPLMAAIDSLNRRIGNRCVAIGLTRTGHRNWQPSQLYRSPRYTTHIDELPVVRAQQAGAAAVDTLRRSAATQGVGDCATPDPGCFD